MKIKIEAVFLLSIFMIIISAGFSHGEINSSESASTSEWTMYGRTLNNSFYYSGYVPPNISTLIMKNFSTSNSIGQQTGITVLEGFAYATDWTYVHKLNVTNFSQEISRSGSISPFSTPVLWNGSVYVGSSSAVRQLNMSNLSHIIATKSGITGYVYHSPIVSNGYLYFGGFNDGLVYQVNATNITQSVKTYTVGVRCYAGPSISGENLYIPCSSTIYQLNASNVSQKIAHLTTESGTISYGMTPLIAEGYVYFGSDSDRFYQVNASNVSKHIANFTTGFDLLGSPVYFNNAVYFGSSNGTLYQVNATNISIQIANITLGGAINSPLTITNNYLFAGAGSRLYQINISNISNIITSIPIGSGPSAVSIADGIIYIGENSRFHQLAPNGTSVIQNSPASNHSITNGSAAVSFSCSALNVIGMSNITLYLTNNISAGLVSNQTSTLTGIYNSSVWNVSLATGNYTWNCQASDRAGVNRWGENRSISISFVDSDSDGVADDEDTVNGDESDITSDGANINLTIGGDSAYGTHSGVKEVIFYDGSDQIINFTHNFSSSSLDLTTISITKGDNYLFMNFSSQIQAQYNKTLYLTDNDFASLCAKDQEVASISEVTDSCTGSNETDLTNCISNSVEASYGTITCVDNGNTLEIGNLRYSAVLGVPESSDSTIDEDDNRNGVAQYIRELGSNSDSLRLRFVAIGGVSISKTIEDSKGTGIKEFEIKTKNWLTGKITIKRYDQAPSSCKINYPEEYQFYKALDFEHSFENNEVENTRVRIGVDKKWIQDSEVSEIHVVRCYPEYEQLRTSYVEESEDEGIYDIYSQGFSTMAVIGVKKAEVQYEPVSINRDRLFSWGWIIITIVVLALVLAIIRKKRMDFSEDFHLQNKWFDFEWKLKLKFNTPPHDRKFFGPK